jgi:hypothetical protein
VVTGGERGGVLGQIRLYIEVSLFLQGTSLLTDTLYISKSWGKQSISSAELQSIVSKTVKYIVPTPPGGGISNFQDIFQHLTYLQ